MKWSLPACVALVLGSCAVGAPPGFSDGDTWSFPLVGPLESGVWLTPVKINGKGPWLFAINPDLSASAVDPYILSELQLMPEPGMQVLNHDDNLKPLGRARVMDIEVGDLHVRNQAVFVKPPIIVRGRWVRGVLGRDVVAPSLVLAVDRDRGMGTLATQGHLKAPPGALKIEYNLVRGRYLVEIRVNDKREATVHLDFGSHNSSLWDSVQKSMGLPRVQRQDVLRDEYGFEKSVDHVGMAAKVKVGPVEGSGIEFAPMGDKRLDETDYDGELGQNFFYPFNMTLNFHKSSVWLKPRTKDVAGTARERMRRWGTRFDSCKFGACVSVDVDPIGGTTCPDGSTGDGSSGAEGAEGGDVPETDAVAGAPPPAPCEPTPPELLQLKIGREALAQQLEYEVTLMAVDKDGNPIAAPLLSASLPPGVPNVFHPLRGSDYASAAAFLPIDMSPFPRPCEKVGGGYRCVWPLE